MNNGKPPVNLYWDLSKTFDTSIKFTLLHNIKHYGIDGLAYKFIVNYNSTKNA